jgi:hypothetical protein
VIKTFVIGSMSIVDHKPRISSPRGQRTARDASWLSAGLAGSRSAAHGPARIADDCSKDQDQCHRIPPLGRKLWLECSCLWALAFLR